MNTEELLKLKQKVEKAKERRTRAKGALSQITKQLKKDFSCETLDKAARLLQKMWKDRDRLDKEIEAEKKKLKKEVDKYESQLDAAKNKYSKK